MNRPKVLFQNQLRKKDSFPTVEGWHETNRMVKTRRPRAAASRPLQQEPPVDSGEFS
jgi:hypothetical protein